MKRNLEEVPIPDESGAADRARQVVARAFAEREPSAAQRPPRRLRAWPAALAAGTAAVVIAVAVSPAGSEFVHTVRHAVGVENAAPALTRLPASGELLVTSQSGPWIVHPDGSKRLLGPYNEASWSPHGLFIAVTRPHQLFAVDPKGTIHWSLARTGTISLPRWSPDGYRIAYLDNSTLRVVAGDGTGDHLLARSAPRVAPAWRPSPTNEHVLAFITTTHRLELIDVDSKHVLALHRLPAKPLELLWSPDGQRLAAVSIHQISVFARDGSRLRSLPLTRPASAAAFVPESHNLTIVLGGHRSDADTFDLDRPRRPPTEMFSGSGTFSALAWSPNGHWLLLAWATADQWLFVPTGDQRLNATTDISKQFNPSKPHAPTPAIDGWCCPDNTPA